MSFVEFCGNYLNLDKLFLITYDQDFIICGETSIPCTETDFLILQKKAENNGWYFFKSRNTLINVRMIKIITKENIIILENNDMLLPTPQPINAYGKLIQDPFIDEAEELKIILRELKSKPEPRPELSTTTSGGHTTTSSDVEMSEGFYRFMEMYIMKIEKLSSNRVLLENYVSYSKYRMKKHFPRDIHRYENVYNQILNLDYKGIYESFRQFYMSNPECFEDGNRSGSLLAL